MSAQSPGKAAPEGPDRRRLSLLALLPVVIFAVLAVVSFLFGLAR